MDAKGFFMDLRQFSAYSGSSNRLMLKVGAPLQLRIRKPSGRPKALQARSELVGVEHGRYLIVKTPEMKHLDDFEEFLVRGAEATIQYLHDGVVHRHPTRLMAVIAEPAELLFLDYPDSPEYFDVRTSPRVDCFLPVEAFAEGKRLEGYLADISRSGCRFTAKAIKTGPNEPPLEALNARIQVLLKLPGADAHVPLTGNLRNVRKDKDRIVFGIQFDENAGGDSSGLSNYLERLMAESASLDFPNNP